MTEAGSSLFGPRDDLTEMARNLYSIAHREGMQVKVAVESLAVALRARPDLDLDGFLRERCDIDPSRFRAIVEVSAPTLGEDGEQVIQAFRARTPTAKPLGANQHGGSGNTGPTQDNTASAVLARLKRDHPDLAQQVIDGTLSAHAAAIQAGIRRPRVSVRTDDPDAAIRALLRHFTAADLWSALASVAQCAPHAEGNARTYVRTDERT